MKKDIDYDKSYPLLPLRDVVVFPHMVIPLFVGRDKSVKALDHAMGATGNKSDTNRKTVSTSVSLV